MKLLFVTSTRVGDAVLSTGILDRLVAENPGIAVTIACGEAPSSLFAAVPGLERVFVLRKRALSLHWLGLWSAAAGRVWDHLVDLRNAPITRLIPARRAWRIRDAREPVHRVVKLAQVLGLADAPPPPRLWASEADRAEARRLVPDGDPVLAVGPTANWIAKTWPAENFAALIDRLTAPDGILPGARVALFGHADERPAARGVVEAVPEGRRIDLVGGLGLARVGACLERCAFYVGNDSGLMHLAAAAGIPTLGLFGPSREALYAPWGPRAAVVRTPVAFEDLFPEGFDPRDTGTLMGGLTVASAAEAAEALWRRVGGGRP